MQPKFSIVICAGGESKRFRSAGGELSKQFVAWDGRPLFLHTLDCFQAFKPQEVCLVVPELERSNYLSALESESFPFHLQVVAGGARRQDSVYQGLQALGSCEFVGIHDGARPFLSSELMKRLLRMLLETDTAIPAIKLVETLKEVDEMGRVVRTVDRNRIVRVQTPQFFRYKEILEVHQQLANSGTEFTDDAMMYEFLGKSVQTCEGDPRNIKVTVPSDLLQAGVQR